MDLKFLTAASSTQKLHSIKVSDEQTEIHCAYEIHLNNAEELATIKYCLNEKMEECWCMLLVCTL
jgi:hypothetical protein